MEDDLSFADGVDEAGEEDDLSFAEDVDRGDPEDGDDTEDLLNEVVETIQTRYPELLPITEDCLVSTHRRWSVLRDPSEAFQHLLQVRGKNSPHFTFMFT